MNSTEVLQNWAVGMTERRRRCFELISARGSRLSDAADKWGNTDLRFWRLRTRSRPSRLHRQGSRCQPLHQRGQNRDHVATRAAKCNYFVSWLGDGAPKAWLKAVQRREDMYIMEDLEELIHEFCRRFDDPDMESKMVRELEDLYQNGLAKSYADRFEELLSYVEWTESYAIRRFDKGLKVELKRALLTYECPSRLTDWIPTVVRTGSFPPLCSS